MRALKILVRILCIIPFATGIVDLLLGANALSTVGTQLSVEALTDPSLNSQLRFFAAIWLGFGVMLWYSTSDLTRHAVWFRLMCLALILSGIGRLISLVQFGVPAVPFVVAIIVEVVVIPLVLLWHWREVRANQPMEPTR
jgi:Domain of unknown function (DUF4345)